MNTQLPVPAPTVNVPVQAKATSSHAVVNTPAATLNITLAPAPSVTPPFENPAVWVPIATFLGVIITIIAGWKKTQMELAFSAKEATIERNQAREQAALERQHHSEQAHQDRITKARREVYLEVISEMIKAQSALSLLPAQNIEKLDIQSGFNGLITATSKISILGEMDTVIMSRELLTIIHESLFRTLALLVPIHEVKLDAERNEKRCYEKLDEIKRITAEINGADEVPIGTTQLYRLRKSLQARSTEAENYNHATIEAKKAQAKLQKEYGEAVLAEVRVISRKVDELISSIRTELSLTTSLEQLHATSEAMHAAALAAAQGLSASLNENEESAAK